MNAQLASASEPQYDVFLSHSKRNKEWACRLRSSLEMKGHRVFFDEAELRAGEEFPAALAQGLERSRFLVLVLSPAALESPWVTKEWNVFVARHGPIGRVIPVLLESVEPPAFFQSTQYVSALDLDVERVAEQISRRIRAATEGIEEDVLLGGSFPFLLKLSAQAGTLEVTPRTGTPRAVPVPFANPRFFLAMKEFRDLAAAPVADEATRSSLQEAAGFLGDALFAVLFDDALVEALKRDLVPGCPRPVVSVVSDSNDVLSLPWELIRHAGVFLVRELKVDLVRSTPDQVKSEALLREPRKPFEVVVNVSAPYGSALDYEAESYRITRALSGECRLWHTELGTLTDLANTVEQREPRGVHFSGHGGPGTLLFENDFGEADTVPAQRLVEEVSKRLNGTLPSFFYLASCHGNDARESESTAGALHRAGVTQVVGYTGPVLDVLSTRAEVALYRALATGRSTLTAVRRAREALRRPLDDATARHRTGEGSEAEREAGLHPFAWSQLVLYHRGPDFPLSPRVHGAPVTIEDEPLRREYEGTGTRKRLGTGFVGRRHEMHLVRRRMRDGKRVHVFQGLGGLGKTTLAFRTMPLLHRGQGLGLEFWCQEISGEHDLVGALYNELVRGLQNSFPAEFSVQVESELNQDGITDPSARFLRVLSMLDRRISGTVVLYFDNLESLLHGPETFADHQDPTVRFADWRMPELGKLWAAIYDLVQCSANLHLVATTRYLNAELEPDAVAVTALGSDALFRMMAWFPALRRLSTTNRARLVRRLAGHPRAVEYLAGILEEQRARP